MSRHRVKNLGYDDDDFEDDDGYDSPDPEEQEFLRQCTAAVLAELRAGQPSVTATTEEVQEALWHYYNDIEKAVNYLRGVYFVCSISVSFFWCDYWGCCHDWWIDANPGILCREEGEGAEETASSGCTEAEGTGW